MRAEEWCRNLETAARSHGRPLRAWFPLVRPCHSGCPLYHPAVALGVTPKGEWFLQSSSPCGGHGQGMPWSRPAMILAEEAPGWARHLLGQVRAWNRFARYPDQAEAADWGPDRDLVVVKLR